MDSAIKVGLSAPLSAEGDNRTPAVPPVPFSQPIPVPPLAEQVAAAGQWPLADYMEDRALPESVAGFRARARQALRDWGLPGLIEAAELVVSELVTNSVTATGPRPLARPVRMWLLSDRSRVLVVVADSCVLPPVPAQADEESDGGRGLLLVDAVSARWGWYACPESGLAKAVWAELAEP